MNEFWDRVILDNTVQQYAIVFAIVLAAYIFKKFVGRFFSAIFFMLMKMAGRTIERQAFLDLIVGPVGNFLFVLISYSALNSLSFPGALNVKFWKASTPALAEGIAESLIIWFLFAMVLKLVDYVALIMGKKADLTPTQDDNQLIVFFKDFLKVIIVIIGVLTVLKFVFHEDITQILAGLSIAGAALALAARESLENLIASFIIFFDKPFTSGDLLKVNNITGTVEHIGLRSTRIRTTDKTYVTVPNKQMVDSVVDNLSLRTHRRVEIRISLDTRTTSSQLTSMVDGLRTMLREKNMTDYNVLLNDITQDSYQLTMDYVTPVVEFKAFNAIKEDINVRVVKLMEELGIELSGNEKNIRVVRDQPSSPGGNV